MMATHYSTNGHNHKGQPMTDKMNDVWRAYAADFNAMTDKQIEDGSEQARGLIAEQEDWLEAVASWEQAGKPRT